MEQTVEQSAMWNAYKRSSERAQDYLDAGEEEWVRAELRVADVLFQEWDRLMDADVRFDAAR